ncbi:hypothetical protein EC957_012121 [Mortierella hygrophila]|uniref:HCP-like protein n=1 Tax=Mortierella hygrophila TaxID=979708 RepID=A0A9P6K2Y1_9FUNG|nr:hypothetical protein EC957_012121 [Mortierella hygrophila]
MGASYDTNTQSSFSSTKPSSHQQHHNQNQHRTDTNLGYSQQQQHQQKHSPRTGATAKGAPVSPISPSSPASMGYVTANKSTARVATVDEAQSRSRAKTVGEGQSRYDQSQYQQPRTTPTVTLTSTAAKEQSAPALSPRAHGQQAQAHYGGPVPRPRAASAAAQTHNAKSQVYDQGQQQHVQSQGQGYGQEQGLDTMKQSPSMGSGGFAPRSPSSPSSHSFAQQNSRASPSSKTALSPPLPKQGSASSFYSLPSPTTSDRPSLLTVIPSASLALSFDQDSDLDYPHDQEKHQQQALEYQRRLQQKPPPKQGEEGSDDDSDSGSVRSYRRSIHRLSMTYKGRPGVPNISVFSSNQRSNVIHHDRSASGSSELSNSQMMIKDQREARLQHQQQQQPPQQQQQHHHQQHQQSHSGKTNANASYTKQEPYGSGSSLASIDRRPRQDDGRPVMVRANTSQSPPSQRPRDIHIPERSSSADTLHYRSKSEGRPGQSTAYGQQNYHQHHPMPTSPSFPSRSQMDPRPSHDSQRTYQQLDPRPSHESSKSQRPQHLNVSPVSPRGGRAPGGYGPGPEPTLNNGPLSPGVNGGSSYSQNPGRSGGSNGGASHHPLPTSSRGPVGYGQGANAGPGGAAGGVGGPVKLHPVYHLPTNGYVRPEEAFGPSNPMPEKAEDFVRQGIEFHEIGEISKATQYFRSAAEMGDPVGMLMYGLSVRHGWGCKANRQLAFQYLQKSAEHAVGDLKSRDSFASKAAKGELVLAIYELGICFRHGWGAEKNKKTAAYYFEIAANLGDPDAQNDLAWCYYHGVGVKKDMYKSAKYYRLAEAQGMSTMGNSWIWKDKYGGPTSPTTPDKGHYHHSTLAALG